MLSFWLKQLSEFKSDFEGSHYTKEQVQNICLDLRWHIEYNQPWILTRLGDLETIALLFGKTKLEKNNNYLKQLFTYHLGINIDSLGMDRFRQYQDELQKYFLQSDVAGSQWRSPNVQWSRDAFELFKLIDPKFEANHIDVVVAYELVDRALIGPLLENKSVLIIGNPASKLKACFKNTEWRQKNKWLFGIDNGPSDTFAINLPHDKYGSAGDCLEQKWLEIKAISNLFDIVLIAGSVCGKILGGRIYNEYGGQILELGYGLQQIANAPTWLCPINQAGRRGFQRLFKGRSK